MWRFQQFDNKGRVVLKSHKGFSTGSVVIHGPHLSGTGGGNKASANTLKQLVHPRTRTHTCTHKHTRVMYRSLLRRWNKVLEIRTGVGMNGIRAVRRRELGDELRVSYSIIYHLQTLLRTVCSCLHHSQQTLSLSVSISVSLWLCPSLSLWLSLSCFKIQWALLACKTYIYIANAFSLSLSASNNDQRLCTHLFYWNCEKCSEVCQ